MKKKLIAAILSFSLLLSLSGCGRKTADDAPETPAGVAVQVQKIERRDISTENIVSGKVSANSSTSVYVSLTAKCLRLDVEVGDTVQAGDIICRLDITGSLASYRAAEIGYSSAVSGYEAQKNILDKQVAMYEKTLDNTKALLAIGAASQLEVDSAELQYLTAKATRDSTLSQLEAGVQSAKSGYEQLSLALENIDSNGNVIAPVDGRIASLNVTEGNMVAAAYPVAVIDGAEQMKVLVSVSEALVPKLSLGDTAKVSVSSLSLGFDGVIRSIEQTANIQTKLYTVTLSVPVEVNGLMNGMFADVTFHTDSSEGAVVVPAESVLSSNGESYVFTVTGDTAARVAVTTGLTGSGMTEVLSGLNGGETVVTVGQQYLSDGDTVRVVEG